jgi:DNA-binding response OmpR family regulator
MPTRPLDNLFILLAEDTVDCAFLSTIILQKAGAEIEVVADGESAIVHASAIHYDVVILDIELPVIDGFEVTRRLRSQSYAGAIIIYSAHAYSEYRERALAAGCSGYIVKPISNGDLVDAVAQIYHRVHKPLQLAEPVV